MTEQTMKELLEAGVHFGHQKRKWNPRMKNYIFGEKSGIYIIDLEKTIEGLRNACSFLREIASKGERIIFVGTKKQAQEAVSSEATRCGMLYVNRRWLGGTLSNFETLRSRIRKLRELTSTAENPSPQLTKKEMMVLRREKERLERSLTGIENMESLPQAMVVVDPHREKNAVCEANKMGIPLVGIIDTNGDPDVVEYPIPANDDAIRSVKLLLSRLTDAVIDGTKESVRVLEEKTQLQETAAAEAANEGEDSDKEVKK